MEICLIRQEYQIHFFLFRFVHLLFSVGGPTQFDLCARFMALIYHFSQQWITQFTVNEH